MKKIFALILSLALALSLCLTSFAESMEGDPPEVLPDTAAPLTEDNTQPLENPEVTTEPTTQATTEATTEATTQATTEATTEATTQATTEATTEATTQATTEPTTESTTENTTENTTEAATEATTESQPETTVPVVTQPPETTAATEPQPTVTESHTITKHPTSETVHEGGYAEFVARADNCINIIWHLQSSAGTDILAQNAPITFPGLEVSGLGSERLSLNRIPKGLDDWRVRAEFVYISGNSWSDPATITVLSQGLSTPTVLSSPRSASLSNGQSTSLQVSAQGSGSNSALTYQWYQNTVDSNVGGKAILGATNASYVPEQVPGTVYYYCAVRSSDGTNVSAAAKTSCAAVSYPAAPSTQPSAAATIPVVTQPASAATLATWGAETTEQTLPPFSVPIATTPTPTRTVPKTNSLLVVIVAVIIVIAVMGVIAALVILKYHSDREDEWERPARQKTAKPTPRYQSGQKPKQTRYQSKAMPKQTIPREENPEWDDLSDLDLSYYLDDEDDL